MAGNSNLTDSARNKQDEFYTNLSLIENELKHYKQHFKNKIVLCNCDDPYESNFFKYFSMNFNTLGLKKLICTCYASSPVIGEELSYYVRSDGQLSFLPSADNKPAEKEKHPYKVEITSVTDVNGDGRTDLADVEFLMKNTKNTMTLLEGNGDFRSSECIELMKQADIIVTNPPFSLFRDFISLLVKYKKKYLIIGNLNNVTYKEVLPLVTNNKAWIGYNTGHFWFRVPNSYEAKKTDFKIDENGVKWRRMGNICWYTNLDIEKRHENMVLYQNYDPALYPHYLNFDGIEVSKTKNIPIDYDGYMGVPITFLGKYNPDQFELLGLDKQFTTDNGRFRIKKAGKDKTLYARLVIRRKKNDEN